jgi:hypothetical protein
VDAGQLQGGDRFVVGIFEADESLPGASNPVRVPASGGADLGAWGDAMTVKVVVLPANDPAVDGSAYNPSADVRAMMEADLYNLYPVQNIEVVWHDPVQISGCNDGANILSQVSSYRNSEGMGPEVYYQALFSDTHNNNCWAGGMAWLVGADANADRVSYSINHPGQSPNNFTHELGHSHGREHSFEDTANYEPNAYPGPDCGRRTTNGYALQPAQHPKYVEWNYAPMATMEDWIMAPTMGLGLDSYCLGHANFDAYGPAMNDVMSYAYPYWVSAYTYRNLAERVRVQSTWSGNELEPSSRSLHLVELLDQSFTSYEMAGAPSLAAANEIVELALSDDSGKSWPLQATRKIDGDGVARGYVVELPDAFGVATSLSAEGRVVTLAK